MSGTTATPTLFPSPSPCLLLYVAYTCSAVPKARAGIVNTGLKPPFVTCSEPSATYRLS